MDQHSLTVLFDEPFWIGIFERISNNQTSVCKVTFGAEPTEQELMTFLDKNWNILKYSLSGDIKQKAMPKNPKRQMREAKKETKNLGIGTKSQQLLKQQQEESKRLRRMDRKEKKEAEQQRKFELKQIKRKEKHRGH